MEPNQSTMFYDFLDRMRNPASLDLVRSIKSFIVSFSFYAANSENDGKKVQEFFLTMEAAMRDHPLWAGANDEEIDCAMEGLEKYVMTKLFSRTFASSAGDVKIDQEVSKKIGLLQTFLKPEHLDIPVVLQNEATWLHAEEELRKINAVKAPREKLSSIMNCCRIINNLLLDISMSEDHVMGGADDFLPVLIYVTIKANPPQLHSNLKFIQLYRRQAKLISEAAYYLTNLISVESFIIELNAKSLSIEEIEFEESMEAARVANRATQFEPSTSYNTVIYGKQTDSGSLTAANRREPNINGELVPWQGGSNYPYMEAEAGELTVADVDRLLYLYKDVVSKYASLYSRFRHLTISNADCSNRSKTTSTMKETNKEANQEQE